MQIGSITRADTRGRKIELDFIRGLAILAVMGFHFHVVDTGSPIIKAIEFPLKNFGQEGVNLFFTLSGFLVGGLLLRQLAEVGTIDAGYFIVRRIFKIWPAYYALILFHVIVGRHPSDTFLVQNALHLQNYLGSSIAQTWSLAIEEHFYLLLPALLLLCARAKFGGTAIIRILGALCVVVLIARCAAVYQGELRAAFAYTQYRIDSLLMGVILAALYWLKPNTYAAIAQRKGALIVCVVGLVAWLVFASKHTTLDRSIGYTIQAMGFCAMIVLITEYSGAIKHAVLYRMVAWLGVYSYGIYLWHSVALAPGDMIIHRATALGMPAIAIWMLALASQFAIGITAGYLTTRVVEFPFLRIRDALFPSKPRPTADSMGQTPAS